MTYQQTFIAVRRETKDEIHKQRGKLSYNKFLVQLVKEHHQLHAIFAVQELKEAIEKENNAQFTRLSQRQSVPTKQGGDSIGKK